MSVKLEKVAEAWSSSSFPPAAALERLEPVLAFSGELHGPASELVAAAAEVGEALRAERPEAVRGAVESWCEAVDWATVVKHTEVSRVGVLAIAMDEATLQRKTLLGVAQDDALRLLRAAAPGGAVDAGLARDLILWLELGDQAAKARIAPRFAVALPQLSPSSRLDIALRALELVLPPSLPVEARLRALVGGLGVGEYAVLASLAGAELAESLGVAGPLHRLARIGGIEAPFYAPEAYRALLLAAFAHRPALFHELLGNVCAFPNVGSYRALGMTDGIAWTTDLEVRSAKGLARVRHHGPVVLSWAGALGKSGAPQDMKGALKYDHLGGDAEGAARVEAFLQEQEQHLGAKRAAPKPHLPKATKKASVSQLLSEAGRRLDRGTVRSWVLAGAELNPVCEDPWERPPLFDLVGDPESVRFLLAHGADPQATDGCDATILEWAANEVTPDFLESARQLIAAGVPCGDKGFRRAAEKGNVELLELLVQHGRRPSRVPELVEVAKAGRHHATVAFLKGLA